MSKVSLQIILSIPRRATVCTSTVWMWSVNFGRFYLGISYCSACNACQETVLELYGAGREDCTKTSQPMEALLFFHGADFNTANLMERKCPHIQSFLAHCCFFISQLSFLYERPHCSSISSDPVEYRFIYYEHPFSVFCFWEYE